MAEAEKALYSYNGGVMVFDRVVASSWKAETFAKSEKQAMSHLAFRYKQEAGLVPSASVKLMGKVRRIAS